MDQQVMAEAVRILGSREKALTWLKAPSVALGGNRLNNCYPGVKPGPSRMSWDGWSIPFIRSLLSVHRPVFVGHQLQHV